MANREMHTAPHLTGQISRALHFARARLAARSDDTLAWQMQLAQVAAPTGAETNRSRVMTNALNASGCATTRTDDAGNVIATIVPRSHSGTLAPVVCLAHLDTVFDLATPLHIRREGNRIVCPGIGDNSRGLAAMVSIAHELAHTVHSHELRRPIELVATVGEEGLGNLRGAHAYFANRSLTGEVEPYAVVVLDGPGDQNIVHHALGSRRYHISFSGPGGHSWADFGRPNAVHAASRAAAWLADVPRSLTSRVALTVSGIGGGESVNSIPVNAWLDVDMRGTDNDSLAAMDVELRRIVLAAANIEGAHVHALPQSVTARHSGEANNECAMQYDIALLGERPCGMLSAQHTLVRAAQYASLALGIEPVSAIASTDANVPLSLGIPAIAIGGGGTGGGAHTVHEWFDNTNATRGLCRAFAIIAALAA